MSKLGLLDKNGVEIQEGDTLLVDWKDPVSGYESKEISNKEYNSYFSEKELAIETWKDIVGYESLYQVSNLGRVRSLNKIIKCAYNAQRSIKGTMRKPDILGKSKRTYVDLHLNGRCKNICIARLVLLSFIGPCPEGMEACHNDGNCQNNRLENLRWDTKKNNMFDKIKHGTSNRGEKHGIHKLTTTDVLEIRRLYATGKYLQKEISERYSVNRATITNIINRKTWGWLNE